MKQLMKHIPSETYWELEPILKEIQKGIIPTRLYKYNDEDGKEIKLEAFIMSDDVLFGYFDLETVTLWSDSLEDCKEKIERLKYILDFVKVEHIEKIDGFLYEMLDEFKNELIIWNSIN